ncbi:MAG: precorrin-6y C5,15-methyltransferase (decarboxylating) subunit CbiE [Silicimonas sp.]|nr:precorrin-6y C5,15-methyltransferase (decarboxylating) subunit CbiE [Silicimonas sp.]
MAEAHWLTIIGLGEDGPEGLSAASQKALGEAEVVMGSKRHLALVPDSGAERVVWPVPFADGLPLLDGLRGRQTVVLASGDPFWFGAGSILANRYEQGEWRSCPGVSVFSLAASRLGWALEKTSCLGCHAAPFSRLRPSLVPGQRALVTLRDGAAVADLAAYLAGIGFGGTRVVVLEGLGGPHERVSEASAASYDIEGVRHPVCVGLEIAGDGSVLTSATGQSDEVFDTDGQITKRVIRAVTVSTLAPRRGEHLWDIGSGSGSIAIEWLMSHPSTTASAIEARSDRAARIKKNAQTLGQDRLFIIEGFAPVMLDGLPSPQAVFVGGGLTSDLLDWLWTHLETGTRIVANAVTLETSALLSEAQGRFGGSLIKIDLSEAAPLGKFRGWKAAYPVVQWSVTR